VDTADDNTVILYEDEAIITLMNRPPQANGLLREATGCARPFKSLTIQCITLSQYYSIGKI